jgi:hypothetical protein
VILKFNRSSKRLATHSQLCVSVEFLGRATCAIHDARQGSVGGCLKPP